MTGKKKGIPVTGMCTAAVLLVLTTVTLALLLSSTSLPLPIPADAQVQPTNPPPTFVSSTLDGTTRILAITFSETIDAANIVPAKIHLRESGTYTGGVTLTDAELDTTADSATISFTLTESHLATVAAFTTPELTIDPGAVQDTSGALIDGTFDASTRTFVGATDISSQETFPTGMAFSNDGLRMFVIGSFEDNVNEYTLTTAFDASTRTFVGAADISSQETFPTGMAFSNDGLRMFVIGSFEDNVNEYTLTTAFDASTRTFVGAADISAQESDPTGMAFSNDGLKMFVIGFNRAAVNEYTLTTPFDASTLTFVGATDISPQEPLPTGIAFSNDGLKMFVIGAFGGEVNEYTLTTPFDASTLTFVDATSISAQESDPTGMAFSSDGAKMFVIGAFGDEVNEYTLSSVYPITVTNTSPPPAPPTFVSSTLDGTTRILAITFSETTDAANIVPAKIHLRESGTYTGGVTLTDAELDTTADSATISFTLTESHLATVAAFTTPELTIDPGAVQDTSGALIDGTFDASTRTFVGATDISSQETFPTGMAFSNDGLRMFVIGSFEDNVNEYTLTTAFDASTRTFVGATDISSQETFPTGMAFSNDGLRMFVIGSFEDNVNEYTLTTAFDASTRTFVGAADISAQESDPTGMAFSNDGLKMFVIGFNRAAVNEYTLTTPFDASTLTFVGATDISPQEPLPTGIAFSNDGLKMFVIGAFGGEVNEYTLTTPFDASTLTFVDATSISAQESDPTGMAFSNDGLRMFVIGSFEDNVNEYTLTTAFDASTRTFVGATDISSQETFPTGMAFSNDGLRMFVIGSFEDNVNEYTLTTAFDASTRTFVGAADISAQESDPTGMAFSNDGLRMFVIGSFEDNVNEYTLTTAFDASTRTFVGAADISAQESDPTGMAFSNDGLKMFVIGFNRAAVNEYTLTTPFDASTLTFVGATDISPQEPLPTGIAFSNDGLKMFVIGAFGGEVNEYTLTTPFDASTLTFVDATSISAQESDPTGMAFSSDGAKMFVIGSDEDNVNEYTLSSVYPITVTDTDVNADPVLQNIGSKSVDELATLVFTATASDDDADDALTFSMTDAPTGASINQNTGAFTWTPTEMQDGSHSITVSVSDGNGGTDSETVTVTVNEVNEDPVLASVGSKSVDELAALSFTASATDADAIGGTADTLTFSLASGAPAGASIGSATGSFTWTPTEQQDGVHNITIRVQDGAGATDSENIQVTVGEVNVAPVLNPIGSKSVTQLETLSFTATATDNDTMGGTADTLTFSMTDAPTGASINQNTGAFTWTPTANHTGAYTITVTVTDGAGASDSEAVVVTVTESNQNPVLGSIGSKNVNEGATLSFNATATDGNNDTLAFSLVGTPPSGASINQNTGAFTWTPTEMQDGSHSITVSVSDGNGGTDSETVTVTVNEVNEDPVLASVGSKSVDELAALSFTASATDADAIGGTADTLTFSLASGAPAGASIGSATGSFTWTPTEQQDGVHNITIRVQDGAGATDSENIQVTVGEVNVAPVLNPIGSKSVTQLETLSFTATATDNDTMGGTADTLTFSMTDAPTGASINQNTGAFTWTPTANHTGAYTITVTVTDGAGASDSEAVVVTVTESNQNPVLGSIGSKNVNEGATLSFNATATDGNNDTLAFSLVGTPPSGASINQNTGAFTWTPTEMQDGSHSITVSVSDGNGGTDSETVTVTVNEVNEDPVLASVGSKSVDELAALSFTASATDADAIGGTADTLTFSLASGAPAGASIGSATGSFTWTPTEQQDGVHNITIRVQDGAGATDSENIQVTVGEVNVAPVLNPIGSKSVTQLETLSFTATATDNDTMGGTADTLTFSMTDAPTGASINQNTGAFTWTPTANHTGAYTITVTVTDGAGASDSEAVVVTVTESNQNPVLGSIGSKNVNEGATLSFNATATDGNNDTLAFSLVGTPPSGASINQNTGAFTWTPTEMQDGSHSITVSVSDGNGGTDSETVTVTVNEVNEDPVLASVGSKSVDELAALSFTASATDADAIGGTADTLTFSLASGAPAGASIGSATGSFTWTPTEQQDGVHNITIRVQDGAGATDSENIQVTVGEVNVAPVLNPIGSKSVTQLETLSFTATATDNDTMGGTADTLTFSMTDAPTGASINQNTGAFTWTPTASQVGMHTITFQVEDGAGATDSEAITVTVSESNENPVLGAIGPKSVDELATLVFTATASDDDDDTLTFSLASDAPAGASINPTTGEFIWTPTELQDGTHSITVRVSDGNGGSDSETITVTVSEVNEDPVLNPIGPKGVNRPGTLTFTATASDGDVIGGTADSLEFSLTGTPPSGASITSADAFSWTPTASQIGTHTITIQVEDGSGATDSGAVTVRIIADSVDPLTTRSGGGGGSLTRSQAPALDFGTLKSYGLAPIPQDIAQLLKAFDRDEPIPPVNATGLLDPPLVINGSAYMLGGIFNTLEPQTLKSGEPISIIFTVYSRADIVHFTLYMNLQGADPRQSASDTYIRFDRGTVSVADPNGFIAGANVTITQDPGAAYKYRIQVDVEFAKGMEQTGMIIGLRSARSAPTAVYVINAFEVLPPAIAQTEPDVPEPEPDMPLDQKLPASPMEAFHMWAGFGPATIGDAGLAAALGYPDAEIPPWVKTGLAPLVVNGYVTIDEFATALEYVLGAVQDRGARDAAESQPADPDTAAPTVTSIERSDPAEETTLVFGVTFGEDVTGVDAGDFALSPDSTGAGSTANLTGSGNRYLVTVLAPQGGTYNLDVVQDSGITDAAGNPLSGTNPTGADHTYTVIADTTAPTVASIERSDPAEESTSETTLVFGVTFGEDVTGVDAGDFALSPDSGSGPGQFTHTRAPGLAIPDSAAAVSDAITVPGFGTATSVSVSVDIAHPFIGDLMVELVAPDGTSQTLHRYSGEGADDIIRTYAPDFGGTGIAGDWTLRVSDGASGDAGTLNGWTLTIGHDGAGGSVTGLAGSGSRYLVTVLAPQGGTYNLGVVQDSGITDAAGNPLSGTNPTGADHTYTVIADTTAPTVASIERSDPAGETTSAQTLVFAVTFSEDVTGVDLSDFALSPDSTGGGSGSGQFTQTSEPALRIADRSTIQDAITVDQSGTATSVSVAVDISHTYRGDLVVELIAPDGTSQTLHSRTGGSANDIDQTYTPDFDGTGIAGDWILRVSDRAGGDTGTMNGWTLTINHGGAGSPVTGLAGSGSQYLVSVSAAQDGTYNLDLVSSGHGITDAASNPLSSPTPTGADHTYTRDLIHN